MLKNGDYELVKPPDNYPGELYRGKYCYEHHLVWWENTGEIITKGEVIHHKNEDKRDNRFCNLEKEKNSKHSYKHRDKATFVVLWCVGCGKLFFRRKNNSALTKSKTETSYCSRSCIGYIPNNEYKDLPSSEDQVLTIFKEYQDKI